MHSYYNRLSLLKLVHIKLPQEICKQKKNNTNQLIHHAELKSEYIFYANSLNNLYNILPLNYSHDLVKKYKGNTRHYETDVIFMTNILISFQKIHS